MKICRLLVVAGFAAVVLAGCAGVDARRVQRRAAFDPLRPDPEFRLLPDRPLHKFNRAGAEGAEKRDHAGSPHVWKSGELDACGLESTASKFFPARFELYVIARAGFKGRLRVRALNAEREEIGRAHAAVDMEPDGAGWVVFDFPARLGDNEVKVVAVELAK